MWMDESQNPTGQPDGFATPEAPALGAYSTATVTAVGQAPVPAPAAFTIDGDPGPRLDLVAPAPPERRDPKQPFEAGQDDQLTSTRVRDPREPIVTESFSGAPDFAPPTGKPVTAAARPVGQWASPAGQAAGWGSRVQPGQTNVGAIARPVTDPYAQRLASLRAGTPMPGGYPAPGHAGYPQPRVPVPARTPESEITARFRHNPLVAVLQAVPWPVLIILFAGVVLPSLSVFPLVLAWIICSSSTKAGRGGISAAFGIASGIWVAVWVLRLFAGDSDLAWNLALAEPVVMQWLCGLLIVALPIIAWRALAKPR